MSLDSLYDRVHDDTLRRKLITRRGGQLHAFTGIMPARCAVVIIDAVHCFLAPLPEEERSRCVAAMAALAAAARTGGAFVAWVRPLPPKAWRSAAAAMDLLGSEAFARYEADLAPDAPGQAFCPSLGVQEEDGIFDKSGFSAFYPGNSLLPEILEFARIDTIILAGVLTETCVTASARDAFEGGYRVIVCADACGSGSPETATASLRGLARTHGDIRSLPELQAALAAPSSG